MDYPAQICAILFFKAEPVSIKRLAELLDTTPVAIEAALSEVSLRAPSLGLNLLRMDDSVTLATGGSVASVIENLIKDELHKDIGKAGLETLSLILYMGPLPRSRIDYIRGVQSTFILRNLLIRGLIKKSTTAEKKRGFVYEPTFELLQFMGVTKPSELPDFERIHQELLDKEASVSSADEVEEIPEDEVSMSIEDVEMPAESQTTENTDTTAPETPQDKAEITPPTE